MSKLWAVTKREYLERVRTKWFIVATILGPIMLVILIVLPLWLAMRSRASENVGNIEVIDASGTELGARVLEGLSTGPTKARLKTISAAELAAAESTATRAVVAREVEGYLVLDEQTMQREAARYAGRNASTIPDMQRLENVVQQAVLGIRLQNAGLDAQKIQGLSKIDLKLATERITERGRGGSGRLNVAFAFMVAFLLYMVIILYGQSILRGVIEEKTTRVAEVVVASVSPDTLLGGKVLGVGAVGLTQQLIWGVCAVALVQLRGPILERFGLPSAPMQLPDINLATGLVLILFFVLGYTFYASLFAAVGSMVNNEQDANQAATPVTMLIVLAAIFIQPVLLNPSGRLSQIVSWLPFSAPVLMPVRMSLIAIPWYEIAAVVSGMVVACVLAVWVSARIYRVGILMYGKKPTFMELGRWIRQAR
jgi:ABC-2 type transport system permease protein